MRDLRILFMGTPEFATATLTKILDEGYKVVGIITAPDRPAGRGRKLQESDVKKYAVSKGLTVLQPTNLKNEDFLSELKALNANLQIVVAFRMLPKAVWAMPEFGTFNLHASLLPDYRGAAPINWAIINGETETGATTFFIDDKIDTGEIILQKKTDITESDTAGTLHDRLMYLGADLVVETVRHIEKGQVSTEKQKNTSSSKIAHKIHRETCEIEWSDSLETIHNKIRGLSPYPTAWTTLVNGGEKIPLKIYGASKEKTTHQEHTGKVLGDGKTLKIAVKNGFIHLLGIQLPGKRKMKAQDLLNGFNFEENAMVT
ncbi:methionyl-tRNA formyltransferase [Pricia sp.]|uniref:methionyl-tRNA formyltransferase n=1 Tax=Pricia sp. TaxID=2268138 RepID=UPI0035941772